MLTVMCIKFFSSTLSQKNHYIIIELPIFSLALYKLYNFSFNPFKLTQADKIFAFTIAEYLLFKLSEESNPLRTHKPLCMRKKPFPRSNHAL